MNAISIIIVILVVLVGLCVAALRWRHFDKVDRRPPIGTTAHEWMVIASPLAIFGGLMVLCLIGPLRNGLVWLAGVWLDAVCAVPLPFLMCGIAKPIGWFAAALLASHLAFLVGSALFVRRIVFGDYRKPANYDARPTTGAAALGFAVAWLIVLCGGYLFAKFAAPLGPPFGIMAARHICLWIRFRKPRQRWRAGSTDDSTDANRS